MLYFVIFFIGMIAGAVGLLYWLGDSIKMPF